jgi:hypothetical protein
MRPGGDKCNPFLILVVAPHEQHMFSGQARQQFGTFCHRQQFTRSGFKAMEKSPTSATTAGLCSITA